MAVSTHPPRQRAEPEPQEVSPEAVESFLQAVRLNPAADVRRDFGSIDRPGSRRSRRAESARKNTRRD